MEEQNELKGLGGWLVLVGIGVVISPISVVLFLVSNYVPLFLNGSWELLTTAGSEYYNPMLVALIAGELIFNLVLLAFSICLIYLFFSKHYLFPMYYIIILAANIIFIPLDAWLLSLFQPDQQVLTPEFARSLIGGVIWIPYMLVSKRVKATFVEKSAEEMV